MTTFPCFKCNGSGQVSFRHIENGKCFQCAGSGKLSYRQTAKADPHPELLVAEAERATDKQWSYLLRLVREDDDKFCKIVRKAGAPFAAQRYIRRDVMSRAIEMAREGA
jgi:hypothetical protein